MLIAAIVLTPSVLSAAPSSEPVQQPIPPLVRTGDLNAERVPGQLIVKFRAAADPVAVADVESAEALEDVRAVGRSGARLKRTRPGDERGAIERLSRSPLVEYVEPNYIARA
ncbi:MAG: hypothetical protein HW416_3179, partial [Chloroflexi bacterium]|nr:hypothetical protein [Chloroflexota bacterium]